MFVHKNRTKESKKMPKNPRIISYIIVFKVQTKEIKLKAFEDYR